MEALNFPILGFVLHFFLRYEQKFVRGTSETHAPALFKGRDKFAVGDVPSIPSPMNTTK